MLKFIDTRKYQLFTLITFNLNQKQYQTFDLNWFITPHFIPFSCEKWWSQQVYFNLRWPCDPQPKLISLKLVQNGQPVSQTNMTGYADPLVIHTDEKDHNRNQPNNKKSPCIHKVNIQMKKKHRKWPHCYMPVWLVSLCDTSNWKQSHRKQLTLAADAHDNMTHRKSNYSNDLHFAYLFHDMYLCVWACVCACVRACEHTHTYMRASVLLHIKSTHLHTHTCVHLCFYTLNLHI